MFARVRSLVYNPRNLKAYTHFFVLLTDSLSLCFLIWYIDAKNQLNHTWLQSSNHKLETKGLTNVSQGFSTEIYGNNTISNAVFFRINQRFLTKDSTEQLHTKKSKHIRWLVWLFCWIFKNIWLIMKKSYNYWYVKKNSMIVYFEIN